MIAVIFTSKRTSYSAGYNEFNEELERIAKELPGFIQQDSVRELDGMGISISYWRDEETAKEFKKVSIHIEAQQKGSTHYYEWYDVKVCEIARHYAHQQSAAKT
jgi:heme-degrading monooxygenase HmoA